MSENYKLKTSEFGKSIKIRLVQIDRTQAWLIEQVKEKTGLYFDDSYMWKIIAGKLATPKIVQAICEILDLDYPTEEANIDG